MELETRDNAVWRGSDSEKPHQRDVVPSPESTNVQEFRTNDVEDYPNPFRTICIVVAVALSLFLVGLDMTIVATAIPRITDQFSGIDLVGWYGSSFFITLACFQPFWGKVYQFFSLKYSFLLAIFIFELGSLISGVAPSSTILIIGRAITGAGGAGIATGGYAILSVTVRPQLRPIFTGLVTTVYSIASVIGPILGGVFAEQTTWRWCFYVNLPFGGTSGLIVFLLFQIPKSISPTKVSFKEKVSHMDPIGIGLALGTLICLTRALQIAGITKPWNSSEVIGLLVGSAVQTIAFLVSQWLLGDRAMIVARLLKMRIVAVGMAYGFLHEGAFFLLLYYIPIYFQAVGGILPAEAGVRNLPLLLSCGFGSFASGLLISKFGHFVPLMIWASVGGCIGAGLVYTLEVNSPSSQWISYQVLAGLAFGSGLPLAIIAGQAKALPEDLPSTTAMLLFAFNVGSSTALAAGQSVLDNLLLNKLASTAPNVDPSSVIVAGSTEIRTSFAADVVPGIVDAYLYSLRAVYAIVIAYAGAAVFVAIANKWERLT